MTPELHQSFTRKYFKAFLGIPSSCYFCCFTRFYSMDSPSNASKNLSWVFSKDSSRIFLIIFFQKFLLGLSQKFRNFPRIFTRNRSEISQSVSQGTSQVVSPIFFFLGIPPKILSGISPDIPPGISPGIITKIFFEIKKNLSEIFQGILLRILQRFFRRYSLKFLQKFLPDCLPEVPPNMSL